MIFFQHFHHRPDGYSVFQTSQLLPMLVALCFLLALPVFAQDAASSKGAGNNVTAAMPGQGKAARTPLKQKLQRKIMEMQQLKQKQRQVHQKVIKNNPELKKQQENYANLVRTTLAGNLAEQGVDIEHLKTLKAKLQQENLPQKKKQNLGKKFRQKAKKYQKIRRNTLNTPQILKKREALIEGIEEQSPRAVELSQEVTALQQEIRQCYTRFQQQQKQQQQ